MPRRKPNDATTHEESDGAGASGMAGMREMLIPYVLLAVSLQRAHGYWIEEYLRGLGFLNLEMSTLYRTLRQLEKDGLLNSGWEPGPSGPARRVYSLTEAGQAWLDTWANALVGYRDMIDRFFGLYSSPRGKKASTSQDRTGDSTDR